MNRLVTVGLSIAVAPAILIGIANLSGASDMVEVATLALHVAVPTGGVLVAVGILVAARNLRPDKRVVTTPATESRRATEVTHAADRELILRAKHHANSKAPARSVGPRDYIRPVSWLFTAFGVAWRHKWFLALLGAIVAAIDAGFTLLWKFAPALEDLFGAPTWVATAAIGAYAYRAILVGESPKADIGGWSTPAHAVLQAAVIQLLALTIIALCVVVSIGLVWLLSAGMADTISPSKDPVALLSMEFLTRGVAGGVVLLPLVLVGLPVATLLETAVAIATHDVITTRSLGHIRFAVALRRLWHSKYRFVLPSYGLGVVVTALAIAVLSATAALGDHFGMLATILGFAWWVGFVAVVNRALPPTHGNGA